MIIRELSDGTVVRIDNALDDNTFMSINTTGGFKAVDSLPYSEYSKWKMVDGSVVVDVDREAIARQEFELVVAKQNKITNLSKITVTTSSGNTFNGDEVARGDMLVQLKLCEIDNTTEIEWKMADNIFKLISVSELEEALSLSFKKKGQIISI